MKPTMAIDSGAVHIVPAQRFVEGGGFVVHRPFPVPGLSYVDPFLLVDEMGPVLYGPGEAVGAPDHPHRGFETITYLIEGAMQHEDSHGHRGQLGPGDVQWMTAGAGVIHAEMPSDEMVRKGGTLHGFQIWVNLPRDRKMSTPRYQEYTSQRLPFVDKNGVRVRVIAGSFDGRQSPIETTVPTTMVHAKLASGVAAIFPVPPGSNAVVYGMNGSAHLARAQIGRHDVAIVSPAPSSLGLTAGADGFEVLLIAAMPLGEPVARYGPFVMNTSEEIKTAFDDYQAGRFGEIARVG